MLLGNKQKPKDGPIGRPKFRPGKMSSLAMFKGTPLTVALEKQNTKHPTSRKADRRKPKSNMACLLLDPPRRATNSGRAPPFSLGPGRKKKKKKKTSTKTAAKTAECLTNDPPNAAARGPRAAPGGCAAGALGEPGLQELRGHLSEPSVSQEVSVISFANFFVSSPTSSGHLFS